MTRKKLKTIITKELWARSGGYCGNPTCPSNNLFVYFQDGTVTSLEEFAHIIGQSKEGPRGKSNLSPEERDQADNIILLCPRCHSLVDKCPAQFPEDLLKTWKASHEQRIHSLFSVSKYAKRDDLVNELASLLMRNKSIFDAYGPNSSSAEHPLSSDAFYIWQTRCIDTLIPNNKRMSQLMSANSHLLTFEEQIVAQAFELHREGFEFNHLSGDANSAVPMFPYEMNQLLKE